MTNQNPASSQPQSTKLSQEILAKVNSHADRSIDRLFADIEELLSGDLSEETQTPSVDRRQNRSVSPAPERESPSRPRYPSAPVYSNSRTVETPADRQYQSVSAATNPEPPVENQPQKSSPPKQQKQQRIPIWTKAFLSIGVVSIALSGLLLWLTNERKLNIDTSWIPFSAPSQLSPDDTKFAEYMRKSITKIESANTQSRTTGNATTTPTNSASVTPAAATTSITPGVISDVATSDVNGSKVPVSLIKTIQDGDHPSAIFEISGQTQTVDVGKKIGATNWSLLTVAKGEVIIKRVGGEIRSIYVGQKF